MKPSADDEVVCEIVVAVVLRALPKRLVPARSFMSASFQIAQALIDAWLAAHAATLSATTSADALKSRLQSLVGATCTNAWWDDASERLEGGSPTLPLQRKLAEVLTRGRHGLRSISPVPQAEGATGGEAWPERGAAWVLAALEDVVGSVASHSARKAAAAAGRPSTAGSRPGTAQRPATGTQGRHQFQPPVRLQEGTVPSKQTERLRLLGIKHFVVAAKADDDLQNCQLVATCLADVAMGLAPHLESDDLMGDIRVRDEGFRWQPKAVAEVEAEETHAAEATASLRFARQPPPGRSELRRTIALERLAFENMKISWWDGTEPCLNSAYTNGLCNSLEILLLKTPLSAALAPLKEGRISDPTDSRTEDSNLDSPSSDQVREQSEVPAMAAKEEEEVRGSEGYVLNRAEHLLKCLMDGESGSNQGETETLGSQRHGMCFSWHFFQQSAWGWKLDFPAHRTTGSLPNRQPPCQEYVKAHCSLTPAFYLPSALSTEFDSQELPEQIFFVCLAQPEYRERLVAWAAQESQGQKDPSAIQQAILQAMKVTPAATSSRGQMSTKVPSAAKPSQPAGPVRGSWLPKVFVREFNAEGDEVEHVEPDSGDDVFTGGTAIA
eukprot:s451_g29.t3